MNCEACALGEDGSLAWGPKSCEAILSFSQASAQPSLTVSNKATHAELARVTLSPRAIWRASPSVLLLKSSGQSPSLAVRLPSPSSADVVEQQLEQALQTQNGGTAAAGVGKKRAHGDVSAGKALLNTNEFDTKIDKGSSEMYFKYYGMLQHQQNMLQDYIRTGVYHQAITTNRPDFDGKVVMDVGAGSGILSLFAAQAGARKIYAVEAAGIVGYTQMLADGNPEIGKKLSIIHSKIEELELPEQVDVLISEPMGTLLVNERMLESYIYARDRFLRPGGKMFPQVGRIHVALFSDEMLHQEVQAKAIFWTQGNFFDVDLSSLYNSAVDGYFSQVVVDAFDTNVLVSDPVTKILDLGSCKEEDLHCIEIPLDVEVYTRTSCAVHGLACWFDVLFPGAMNPVWLTTAPGQPITHWFQLRCVLKNPIYVSGPGHRLKGCLKLKAHQFQSYDVHLTLTGPPLKPGGPPQQSSGDFDLKEPYYRQLTPAGWWSQATSAAAQEQEEQQQQAAGAFWQQYANSGAWPQVLDQWTAAAQQAAAAPASQQPLYQQPVASQPVVSAPAQQQPLYQQPVAPVSQPVVSAQGHVMPPSQPLAQAQQPLVSTAQGQQMAPAQQPFGAAPAQSHAVPGQQIGVPAQTALGAQHPFGVQQPGMAPEQANVVARQQVGMPVHGGVALPAQQPGVQQQQAGSNQAPAGSWRSLMQA